jgi:hypothetical protein
MPPSIPLYGGLDVRWDEAYLAPTGEFFYLAFKPLSMSLRNGRPAEVPVAVGPEEGFWKKLTPR